MEVAQKAASNFYFQGSRAGKAIPSPPCYNHLMTSHPIVYRIHAIQRMFERRISEENVRRVLQHGELIEDYSDEMPHPGGLMLGRHGKRPLHVVMAENTSEAEAIVITVYEPDPSQWKSNSRDRKK
jgi:hypothetical protein